MPPSSPRTDVPEAVRVQILATEHWSLLATRNVTYGAIFSRTSIFLTVVSAAIVALDLVAHWRRRAVRSAASSSSSTSENAVALRSPQLSAAISAPAPSRSRRSPSDARAASSSTSQSDSGAASSSRERAGPARRRAGRRPRETRPASTRTSPTDRLPRADHLLRQRHMQQLTADMGLLL